LGGKKSTEVRGAINRRWVSFSEKAGFGKEGQEPCWDKQGRGTISQKRKPGGRHFPSKKEGVCRGKFLVSSDQKKGNDNLFPLYLKTLSEILLKKGGGGVKHI